MLFFFFKQKTAYEMRISDWSSDVFSSDLTAHPELFELAKGLKKLMTELNSHQQKEERILFPAIKALINSGEPGQMSIGIEGPVRMMESEHRSDESSVGKECGSTCRSRGWPYH